jgi:hypothetical protein
MLLIVKTLNAMRTGLPVVEVEPLKASPEPSGAYDTAVGNSGRPAVVRVTVEMEVRGRGTTR